VTQPTTTSAPRIWLVVALAFAKTTAAYATARALHEPNRATDFDQLLWRSADGRILLATAAVPQTPSVSDILLLFALCRTRRQALLLAILTHVRQWAVLFRGPYTDFNAHYDSLARLTVGLALIPVMLFALANHGVFRRLPSVPAPDADATAARTPALGWIDGALLFLLLFAFLLQLWLLSGL